jgi:glycosyltransferase involved in cell wall biosynthesis
LVVLGDGELRGELQAIRGQYGLTSCVHFPGFKQYDELPPYYALAAAFIHASTVEPWGLVVNEAMASGLPVLVSNRCGCAPSLVREGENGRTFDPTDRTAITNCLAEVARATPESRQRMGCGSRQIIAEFGPDNFAEGLVEAAKAALGSRGKHRRLVEHLVLKSLLRRSVPQRRQIA